MGLKIPIVGIVTFGLLVGCGEKKDMTAIGVETKPVVESDSGSSLNSESASLAAKATYDILVLDGEGNTMCTGSVGFSIFSSMELDIEAPVADCLGLTFDLSRILNNQTLNGSISAGSGDPLAEVIESFSHDGEMLYIKDLLGVSFEPARPAFIGPIIADHSIYEGYTKSVPSTATWVDEVGAEQSAAGTWNVNVLESKTSFAGSSSTLDNVIHWSIETQGYESVPILQGLTFKKIEWWWSTAPLMLPKLAVTTSIEAILPTESQGVSALLGDVTLIVEARDFTLDN